MKRPSRFWLMSICALACLLGAAQRFRTSHVYAQTSSNEYDDGDVYVYAYIDVDSSYNLYADSYAELDPEADEYIDLVQDEIQVDQDGDVFYDDYADTDSELSEYEVKSTSPVARGYEYGVASLGSVCVDDGEGDCYWYEDDSIYASVNVAAPLPQITSLSTYSVTQGDQGTLTITGSNLVEYSGDQLSINFSGGGSPFTLTGTPSSSTASFSYNFSGLSAGTYTLSVSNGEGTSNSETFTVNSAKALNECAVSSNPHAGYMSITSTGTAGGGTFAVSFSGTAYADISQSVTYGPYSTPSSIAAHIAALITQKYFRYGLTAKAFGPNIVYSGDSTIGTVTNAATGSSFTPVNSPAAASAAQIACTSAPANLNTYTLTPASLNLSTGDTDRSISIYASGGNSISMSGIAYSPGLISNYASNCTAKLSFANGQSSSTVVTASSAAPTGCSGASGVFNVYAAVNSTTTNYINIVVPPQIMIQTLVGEAGAQTGAGDASMPSLLLVAKNRFGDTAFPGGAAGTWQAVLIPEQFYGASDQTPDGVTPELDDAASVFAGTTSVSIPSGCEGYWSPTNGQYSTLESWTSKQAGSITDANWPALVGAPRLWNGQPKQAVIKRSIANNMLTGKSSAPAIVLFQLAPSSTSPAVITIP